MPEFTVNHGKDLVREFRLKRQIARTNSQSAVAKFITWFSTRFLLVSASMFFFIGGWCSMSNIVNSIRI